ncbi:polysaccharide ABC transporter ATP-binding protein [Sulfurovum sp.]|uniref:ABC transporter ATP-binding protein n=1 Tax=Sulfurovum sp. TaxID=1969726 RepID=UPI00356B23B5
MNKVAIKVENLGKKYVINHEKENGENTFREVIVGNAKKIMSFFNPFSKEPIEIDHSTEEFWALNDVSFEINKGDKVGIIGRNGAGKSTLLKVLSRITEPTTGKIHINGRIASLLEVGTGFHPELTGRENIYLNGAILGMSRKEIKAKFDEIVAFAEVEKFLDTPVKRYSSGMYVRLAFSVAAHLEPEILVVDEVLAVGDAAFQKKCLAKMNDVSDEGRTILFVSHNMQAIKQLCNKFLYLHNGSLIEIGTDEAIINNYLKNSQNLFNEKDSIIQKINNLPKDEVFKLNQIRLLQNNIEVFNLVENGRDFEIEVTYEVYKRTTGLRIYVNVLDEFETLLFRSFHDEVNDDIPVVEIGRYVSVMTIPKDILGPIQYTLTVGAGIHSIRTIFTIPIPVSVENTGSYNKAYLGDVFRGRLAMHLPWTTYKT